MTDSIALTQSDKHLKNLVSILFININETYKNCDLQQRNIIDIIYKRILAIGIYRIEKWQKVTIEKRNILC